MHEWDYYFENQNGIKSCDYHIFFEKYPRITMGQELLKKKSIPGRGNVYSRTGSFSDTEIKLVLDVNVFGAETSRIDAYMAARDFILNCTRISFCDALDYFYKVKKVELDTLEQYADEAGDFDVEFLCEPGAFVRNGSYEHGLQEVLQNPYSISHPEYRITGEGTCELIVNGSVMTANVGQNLTINTELMIAYRTDGTIQNTAVTGNYEDLYLQPGTNTISITEGFDLKIVPNWRCL